MTHPTIDRLADALAARTEDALGRLDALDREAAVAFAEAGRAADHAIAARLVRLEGDLADRTRRFETRLADMLSSAVDVAVEALGRAVDELASGGRQANGKTHDHAAALVIPPVEEPDDAPALPTWEESQAEVAAWRDETAGDGHQGDGDDAERCPVCGRPAVAVPDIGGEDWDGRCRGCGFVLLDAPTTTQEARQDAPAAEPTPEPAEAAETPQATASSVYQTSAARSLERAEVGVLAVEDDDEQPGDETPVAVPVVTDPEGLHEKRGKGRGTRYTPCEFPEPGETYYVKNPDPAARSGRWLAVVYAS